MSGGSFEQLKTWSDREGLGFLVIGGLAVNFHGFSRDTADLDLLVRLRQRGAWLDLLAGRGYTRMTPPAPVVNGTRSVCSMTKLMPGTIPAQIENDKPPEKTKNLPATVAHHFLFMY
jgi:hypothetical protein